jgi:hypothetical protein
MKFFFGRKVGETLENRTNSLVRGSLNYPAGPDWGTESDPGVL